MDWFKDTLSALTGLLPGQVGQILTALLFLLLAAALLMLLRRKRRPDMHNRIRIITERAAPAPRGTSPAPNPNSTVSPRPVKSRRKPRRVTRRSKTSGCTWRQDDQVGGTSFRRWVCEECGVEAFTTSNAPPEYCKKSIRPGGL